MAIVQGERPPFDPPGSWPLGVQQLVSRCWAAEPAERPSFAELQDMLVRDALFGEEGGDVALGADGKLAGACDDSGEMLLSPVTSEEMGAELAHGQLRAASGRGPAIEMRSSMLEVGGGGPSAAWTAAAGVGISMDGLHDLGGSRRSMSNIL